MVHVFNNTRHAISQFDMLTDSTCRHALTKDRKSSDAKKADLELAIAEFRKQVLDTFPSLDGEQVIKGEVPVGSGFSG